VRQGGSEVDVSLGPTESFAPQAAAFSPDGSKLAVVDGAGALWIVEVQSGAATQLAEAGPNGLVFGRSVRYGDEDHLYVQLVGSVEIPIPSLIAAVSIPDQVVTLLSDDTWAYGPRPLADGTIDYVHLNSDGSYDVRHLGSDNQITDVAQVGMADWIDISVSGAVAFADGPTTFLVDQPGGPAIPVSVGAYPRFAADGSTVLTYDATLHQSKLIAMDGSVIDTVDSPFAAIVACADGCAP
jgi:hypothetical protein